MFSAALLHPLHGFRGWKGIKHNISNIFYDFLFPSPDFPRHKHFKFFNILNINIKYFNILHNTGHFILVVYHTFTNTLISSPKTILYAVFWGSLSRFLSSAVRCGADADAELS